MSTNESLLDAGALLPIKEKVADQAAVDQVSARSYRHGALAAPVVRLSADSLAKGDDLVMEFLGFEAPEVDGPLAHRRRQALGFPGWALIHDPDHARYALELVKDFKKRVRQARAKPGHAWDGFAEMAKQLGRSVAHFLPSFWEQVGREFIELGNATYASRAFGKAREAEKVHALKVDESIRRDAFLEFALAGCLSNKVLTEYGKELQASADPAAGWAIFRDLCVRRTLGGMSPWTNMLKDVKGLIEAAGEDYAKESVALLAELLEASSLSRAAEGFWKASSSVFQELVRQDRRAAGILLNLIPETSSWGDNDFVWEWLAYLEKWEILQYAWEPDAPPECALRGGAAAWFSRIVHETTKVPDRGLELLERIADRVRSEGKPLDLAKPPRWGNEHAIDIDLLDRALELRLPIADPPERCSLQIRSWCSPPEGAKNRPRDPLFVVQDARFAAMLNKAVGTVAGDSEFEVAAKGMQALAKARQAWLTSQMKALQAAALPRLNARLRGLDNSLSREVFQEFPEQFQQLQEVDPATALARTLRGGLIDEFGWAAAEEVVARLDPQGEGNLQFFGSMPYLIVTDDVQVVVLCGHEVVLEVELQLPKGHKLFELAYYDQDLAVLSKKNHDVYLAWASAPKKRHELGYRWREAQVSGASVAVPEGGTTCGEKVVHSGDKEVPSEPDEFFFDGEHFWKERWEDGGKTLYEFDPRTAKTGRKSLPAFLEDYLVDDAKLILNGCSLLAFGELVADSPLGSRDGQVGWRQRARNQSAECEGIDGRSWTGRLIDAEFSAVESDDEDDAAGTLPVGLMSFPGASGPCPIAGSTGWNRYRKTVEIWDPDGNYQASLVDESEPSYAAGQVLPLPLPYWHLFAPRDVASSKKLRKVTEKQAAGLLAAALEDFEREEDPERSLPRTEKAVDKLLPKLSSPRMRQGILGVIREAARIQQAFALAQAKWDPAGKDEFSASAAAEATVKPGLDRIGIHTGYRESEPLFPHLQAVGAFFAEGKAPKGGLPPEPFGWLELLDSLETQLWAALWAPATRYGRRAEEASSADWTEFFDHWCELPFQDLPGKIRQVSGEFKGKLPSPKLKANADGQVELVAAGGNRYLVSKQYDWDDEWTVLEYAPDGQFKPLPGHEIDEEQYYERSAGSAALRALVAGYREHGPPMLDEQQRGALAERLDVSPGEAGLIWMGFPNFDSYEKNFLPKEMREALKLKVAEADAARTRLQALPEKARRALLASLLTDPASLWNDVDGALERLAKTWAKQVPKRLKLPQDVGEELTKVLGSDRSQRLLVALTAPKSSPALNEVYPARFVKDEDGDSEFQLDDDEADTFSLGVLTAVGNAIPLLFYRLPAGDPARPLIAQAGRQVRACLGNKQLMLHLANAYLYDSKTTGEKLVEKLIGKPKKVKGMLQADNGTVLAYTPYEHTATFCFRPAKLKNAQDLQRLVQLHEAMETSYYESAVALKAVALFLNQDFQAFFDRLEKTPVPDGQYEANPCHSAAELVAEVAQQCELTEDSACLYLQLLALPDPTTANLKLWNGWTAAKIKKVAQPLLDAKLVIEAKRSRAGRNYFLPGGWEALKSPLLPVETWKLPLLGVQRDAEGRLETPLERLFGLQPAHLLFAAAWKRVKDGDAPKYEEVK